MTEITILNREAFNIKLNPDEFIFSVNLVADVPYNESGFQEFLEYFKNTWIYIKDNSLSYLNISISDNKLNFYCTRFVYYLLT